MAILYGIGRPSMVTQVDNKSRLITFEPVSFQLATNTDVVKSSKFNTEGQVVTAGTAQKAVNSTLTMSVEAITWMSMQLAHGEFASVTTNYETSDLKFVTLLPTGPQTIADSAVTTLGKTTVAVYNDSYAESLVPVSGVPGAGQYSVAAGVITVGPGPAGVSRIIGYRVLSTVPTCESIGVEATAKTMSKFRFDAVLKNDDIGFVTKLVIPELSLEQQPSISIESPTKFDLVYTLVTQTGKKRPYELIRIAEV